MGACTQIASTPTNTSWTPSPACLSSLFVVILVANVSGSPFGAPIFTENNNVDGGPHFHGVPVFMGSPYFRGTRTGRDRCGISRPVSPTKTREKDGSGVGCPVPSRLLNSGAAREIFPIAFDPKTLGREIQRLAAIAN